MNQHDLLGRLLGLDDLRSVESIDYSFAAPWAHQQPAWVWGGCLLFCALSVAFYFKAQRGKWRVPLAVLRGAALSLVLIILAEPVVIIKTTSSPRPMMWVLFDGTDSMAIEDELPETERARFAKAVGLADTATGGAAAEPAKVSRAGYVQALLEKKEDNLLTNLRQKFRLRAFVLDRADGVRSIELPESAAELDRRQVTSQLSTSGQVTALGSAFTDLARRQAGGNVAGLLVVSDFDQNSGPAPLDAARKLGVPIYTVGIGPEAALDLAVDLSAPLLMKKAERSSIVVTLRQTGLDGRAAGVKLSARRMGGSDATAADAFLIAQRTVDLRDVTVPVEFPYTPDDPGRFLLTAEVEPLEGEVVDQNNRAEREVNIRDDFLRLMFVEYEPTWEWRFVKEVFHRDKLVGLRGFRTFLRSADPTVRQSNELFLTTLAPPRSAFFANDVIFLGDMPASTLSTRFCEMTKEFVSTFGGGLVIVAGPRFGPGQLSGTPLADMLPVVVDADANVRDERDFALRLTPDAEQIDFMRLGNDDAENALAWGNLGRLPWYQPVARLHPMATALAEHPTDTCVDGQTPQPLIAIRRYGRGEVVYVAFNETWRLRRKYGELYYRQFWGQMIHRLGLSHAPGTQKRFIVRTDRQQYPVDDKVLLTVEAYDAEFEPLSSEKLPGRKLTAELILPDSDGSAGRDRVQMVSVPQAREGVFETPISVFEGGEHLVRVKDPISSDVAEVRFQVTSLSAERRSAVRNAALERELALTTGGKTYDLTTVSNLVQDVDPPPKIETHVSVRALWNTWLCFGVVVFLLLLEWLLRKLVNLP